MAPTHRAAPHWQCSRCAAAMLPAIATRSRAVAPGVGARTAIACGGHIALSCGPAEREQPVERVLADIAQPWPAKLGDERRHGIAVPDHQHGAALGAIYGGQLRVDDLVGIVARDD